MAQPVTARHQRSILPVAVGLATVILATGLAGCGASAASPPHASASPTQTASETDDSAYALDPLSEYLYFGGGGNTAAADRSEEIIAECMREQGFTYTARKSETAVSGGSEPPPPESRLGGLPTLLVHSREWVSEHGYEFVEYQFQPPGYVSELESDPNNTYYESLSPSKQRAYAAALYGKSLTVDANTLDAEDRGCNGKGADAVPSPTGTRPAIIQDARSFLDSLKESPAIEAVFQDYEKCLTDAGYSATAKDTFETKAFTYKTDHPGATSEDAEVVALRTEEITTALADWDCADSTDTLHRYLATLTDLEKDYIAEHKKELEEAQLWLNQ